MNDVRAATLADLDAVAALEWTVFESSAWSPRSVEQEFEGIGESRHIAVATAGDQIAGYAVLLYIGDVADVLRIAVGPRYRRQGWGARLLEQVLQFARDADVAKVMLEVDAGNTASVELYRRFGFELVGRRAGYYGTGTQAWVMSLDLANAPAETPLDPRRGADERQDRSDD